MKINLYVIILKNPSGSQPVCWSVGQSDYLSNLFKDTSRWN